MRPSRVFRLIFRIFILILSLSITIVATLGPFSALLILTDYKHNLNVDTDNAVYDVKTNETTHVIEDFDFALPIFVNNTGYFPIENLELTISLEMNYSHVNFTTEGVNTTRQIEILWKYENFGTIPKGERRTLNLTADMSNFNNATLPDFETEVDWTRGPPAVIFYATLIISLDYSLGLHSITFGISNIQIGEIE
ncbi:MAG: hypothetical protein ACFFCE_10205 [Promethearchaeota archaeon]